MAEKKGKTSIFTKYFCMFAIIITISFTILGIALMAFTGNYYQDEKTKMQSSNVTQVAQAITSYISTPDEMTTLWSKNKGMLADAMAIVSETLDADVFITDAQGSVIICKERSGANALQFLHCEYHDRMKIEDSLLERVEKNYLSKVTATTTKSEITGDGTQYHVVGVPVRIAGNTAGYVFSTMPMLQNTALIGDILRLFLMSTIIALLLAFAGAYILTYRMLRPLQQMSRAAKQFADGDFSYRVQLGSRNDEMADLADSFNEMASELAALEGTRRSFVANVSHELKTPMTTISGFIDGILDGTIPPEKQNYYLKIVSDEVKRLSRLVVAMLNMSKIESGDFKMNVSNYNIADQIFRIFITFEQKINEKHIDIRGFDQLSSTMVHADPDMIYQVIFNLVDNAVKFTNDGGYIEIRVRQEANRVLIALKNSGSGISSEELPKIFERFYKVDRSRSLDVKGAGLGLYIVKSMVEMHGGQITVRSEENQYTEFEFWLSAGGNTHE